MLFFFSFFYSVRTSFAKHQTSSCRLFQHEQVGFPCVQCKPPCESPFQVSNNLNKQHHLRATKLLNTTETFTSTRCLNWLSHLVLEWSSFDMDPCGLHMCPVWHGSFLCRNFAATESLRSTGAMQPEGVWRPAKHLWCAKRRFECTVAAQIS